jgi:Holliday junction DNA helicase RuvA
MSVDDLSAAVAAEDAARLTKIPGIGKKTAERLVLELRDKLPKAIPSARAGAADPSAESADVLNALLGLGYNEREAQAAVKQLPPDLQLADAIRHALKHLAKP